MFLSIMANAKDQKIATMETDHMNCDARDSSASRGSGPLGMPRVVRRMMRARVHTISGLAESVTIECSSCEEARELIGWLESLPHQLDEWKRHRTEERRDEMMWIVGKSNVDAPGEWEFQGVFDSEEQAVAACTTQRDGTVDMFAGPAKLNVSATRRKRSWPGAYYPFTKRKRRAK